RSAYVASLRLSTAAQLDTIAFSNISTGVYGFPKAAACDVAIDAVERWLAAYEHPRAVQFCCFDAENARLYRARLSD
ncbi:O-acetyl-ADP-ribose deacetylase, partial [bacterium]|nr:O-acetyl-ADP-ribose deacetylase [bacterium]